MRQELAWTFVIQLRFLGLTGKTCSNVSGAESMARGRDGDECFHVNTYVIQDSDQE